MKKIISLILCLVTICALTLSVTSCGKDNLIGVQSGTTGQYFVDGNKDWDFEGIEGWKSKGFQNAGLAVADMKAGGVKYVIVDKAPALQLAKAIDGIKIIDIELTQEKYAFGVDKNQESLKVDINRILKEKDAEIKAIIDKYAKGENITGIESAKFDISKQDKQLVVATNAEFAPFEYMIGNKFAGIDIEIMALVAKTLGLELVIQNMDFDSVVTSVGKNGVDVAAAGLSVNEERAKYVNFSDSYYDAAQVLIVPEKDKKFDKCKTAEDVINKLKDLAK